MIKRMLVLGSATALILVGVFAGAAYAERDFICQITGLEDEPPTECNGSGNDIPGGGLVGAAGAVYDSAGNVWVGDVGTSRVLKFSPGGDFLALEDGFLPNGDPTWGGNTAFYDLGYDVGTNLVYAPDTNTGTVWEVNPDASVAGTLTEDNAYRGGIEIAVDQSGGPHAGDIYLAYGNDVVKRFNQDGTPANFETFAPYIATNRITSMPDESGSWLPSSIAIGPDGDIFVLAFSFNDFTTSVKRFDTNGQFIRSYTGAFSSSEEFGTSEVAVDPSNGNFLVGNNGGFSREYDLGGAFLQEINGTTTNTPGEFNPLSNITFAADGHMLIASGYGRVNLFEPAAPTPKIAYAPESEATRTSFTVNATVDPNGAGPITSCEIQYGTTFDYELGAVPCSPAPSYPTASVVEGQINGLEVERDYHFRVVVENASGERRGDDRVFRLAAVEDVTTEPATDVGTETATLHGSLTDDGNSTKFYFEYGNTPALGKKQPLPPGDDVPSVGGTVPVEAQVDQLLPGSVYFFRLVATNGFGTTRGGILNFKTLQAPTIESFSSKEVNETDATLIARINPNGFPTKYRFEYGITDSYGEVAPVPDGELPAVEAVEDVSVRITGLISGTTYHFRLVAESEQGVTTTEDQTFSFFPPNCPNAQVRLETDSAYLPDCRAYELVSPGDAGGIILSFDGPNSPYATNPPRFGFSGIFGTLPDAGLPPNLLGDYYVAERSNSGWSTRFVGIPSDQAWQQGGPPIDGVGRPSGVLARRDLGEFLVWNTGTQGFVCPCSEGSNAPYVYTNRGEFVERLPDNLAQVPKGEEFIGQNKPSGDFSHLFFSARVAVFDTGGTPDAPGSVYDNDREANAVDLISETPAGQPIAQDPEGPMDPSEFIRLPFASVDGSHVLMSTQAPSGVHLYMRVGGAAGVTYDVSRGLDDKNHGVDYVGTVEDGSEVLFASSEKLTADDHDTSQDIFAWREHGTPGDQVVRISTGSAGSGDTDECSPTWTTSCNAVPIVPAGGGGGLFGSGPPTDTVFGAKSGEPYFYSPEQLDGVRGQLDGRNLYTVRDGEVRHVATLDGEFPLIRTQVSPANDHAAFLTKSRLTAYDNKGFAEMYSYDVDRRTLKCVSCIPTGATPTADVDASANGLFMSDDGRTFFTTRDTLVDHDVNGLRDTYEYVDGRPQLISSGVATRDRGLFGFFPAGLVGVSGDGVNVYFATYDVLVPQDHNGQFMKFYVARTGGGFPFDPPQPPCNAADECHGPDSSPPPAPEIVSQQRLGKGGNRRDQSTRKCTRKTKAKAKAKKACGGKKQQKKKKSQKGSKRGAGR